MIIGNSPPIQISTGRYLLTTLCVCHSKYCKQYKFFFITMTPIHISLTEGLYDTRVENPLMFPLARFFRNNAGKMPNMVLKRCEREYAVASKQGYFMSLRWRKDMPTSEQLQGGGNATCVRKYVANKMCIMLHARIYCNVPFSGLKKFFFFVLEKNRFVTLIVQWSMYWLNMLTLTFL